MSATGNEARRLRALVEVGTALSSELSLDALLQRLVEAAAELTDARYAALGVIDRSGTALERFITTACFSTWASFRPVSLRKSLRQAV